MKRFLQRMLLIAALCVPWVTQAQTLETYGFTTGVDASKWVDMTSSTQILTPSNSDGLASAVQNIGFAFPFGSSTYTQYSVNTDGNLRLGSTVTGTSNYTTPFSSTVANQNNPKINAFGCDGYGVTGTHYVKALTTELASGDTVLVVEFCMGTYTTATRDNLYKWQIHLYADGNIDIVFPSASGIPSTAPAVAHQCGICVNSSDGWVIQSATNTAEHFTNGSTLTNASGTWFDANRYYTFIHPSNISCPAPYSTTASGITASDATISWHRGGTETAWELMVDEDTYYLSDTFYTITNLNGNTVYVASVRAICGVGDTSFASSCSFRTACMALTANDLPYIENFENYTSGAANPIDPCWRKGTSSTTAYPYPYSTAGINSSMGLYFYGYYPSSTSTTPVYSWAALPPIDDNLDMSDLMLTFMAKRYSTTTAYYNSYILVGVADAVYNLTSADSLNTLVTWIDTVNLTPLGASAIESEEVSFANYQGNGKYVVLYCPIPALTGSNTYAYNYIYIDDVSLRNIPTCFWPTDAMVASVSTDEAEIVWTPDPRTPNPNSWIVEYDTAGFTPGEGTIVTVTDTTVTLTGLDANTAYDVYVRANCGGGDESDPVMISFRTGCAPFTTLPYSENFDGVTGSTATSGMSNILPPCWDYLNHGTRANYQGCPYVYNSTTYSHSGANCIRFYSYAASGDSNQYLIFPEIDPSEYALNELQIGFWLRAYSTSSTYHADVVVGVITNPYDPSTFVPCTTFTSSSTTYARYEYAFGAYTGGHGRIAFKFPVPTASSNYEYGYIDDVVIEPMPSCPPVANLTVDSLSVDWASISWIEVGAGTSWVIEYDDVNFTPGSGAASYTDVTNDENYFMSNLDTGATYYVYVRSNCGSDTSTFTGITVTTLASVPASVPYTCNFEGSNTNGWEFIQSAQANYWVVGTGTNNGGSKSMYVTDNGTANNYSGSEAYSFATRTFNLTDVGEYAYSYDWKCNGESSFDFLRVALVPASTVLTAGSYSGFDNGVAPAGTMPAGGIALDGQGRMNLQSNWQTKTGTFTITTPGAYTWVFLWRNDGSVYNQPPAAIDNISIVRNTCPAPINFTVTNVTADSIAVSWQPVGTESSWVVSNGVDEYVVTDTAYAFDNLNSSTPYTITVRAICGYDDTSMAIGATVYTACLYATLPIIENFDAIEGSTTTSPTASYLPPCWDYYNDGTRTNYMYCPYVYSSSTYSHSGSNCIRFYSYNSSGDSNQYLILPVFDTLDNSVSDLQLSFWLRAYSTSSGYFANVVVGVMTDPLVESSFIPYDTVNSTSTTYSYHEVNFNHYTGPQGRITLLFPKPLSSSQYEYGYVDDIMLGLIPSCISVDNLTSVYATGDSIILSWVPGGTESAWEVTYDSGSFVVNDTFYVAEYLSPNTEYTFTVRAICSVGDTSYPVTYSTRTSCGAITVLPFIEGFESYPAGSSTAPEYEIPCWARLDNAGQNHFGYVSTVSSWSAGPHTGSNFIYYYLPSTQGTHCDWNITILPPIDTDIYPINTLQMSFWVRMNSSTTSSFIEVGVISNATDETTFVPVDTIPVAGDVHTLKTAYLSNYTGTGNRIAMRFHRTTESTAHYFFIDDITVEPIPDCPPVSNIGVSRITSDSLYVIWTENGNATSWEVEYGPTGFTLGTGTTDVVTTMPYEIGNLTANTAYDIYITPECTSGTSATRMGTFRTDCGPTPVPFTETFDTWSSTAADPLPNCWEKHTNYSTNYPYASTSYYHGSSGKSMYMYSTNTTYSYMVLPAFDLPIDSTMVTFWLYKGNTSYAHNLQVGVITNPADVSTFTPVATVSPSAVSTWEEFEIPFSSYNGNGTRIAFLSPNNEYSYPYLDDLTVSRISGCQRVIDLMASNVMLDSAVITWTDGSNAAWYVEYDSVNFTPGNGTHTPIYVTDTFCILSGLSAGMTYHVYVYPDCDSIIAERGMTFTTLASLPATVPYSCDFEGAGVNGWDLIQTNQHNYWVVGNATSNGGTQSLYVTNNGTANSYDGAASYSFAVRTFNLAAGNYICSYDWKCQGESSFDFIRAALVPAGVTIDAGGYCGFDNASAIPAGSIALDGGYRLNLQGSSWQNQTTEFTLTNAGTYKIVFLWRNDGSVYNQPPAAIDNVQLILNTCPMPSNITLSNLTQTSADVSWEETGSATTWEYQVGSAAPVVVYDTFCNLTGLSANTPYNFRVRSICGQSDTGAWATYNFRTPCGYLTLPYIQDFESEPTGSSSTGSAFANCWVRLNNGTSSGGYPYVGSSSTYNHTAGGSKGLYWYNTTTTGTYGDYQCAVLPPVDPNTGVDSLQLSFWVKASSATYTPMFQIGVLTDPNNISTFVGVDTITVTSGTTWMLVEVPLVSYTGNGQYVAVKADRASWTAYLDDFVLEYVPTCLMPHNVNAASASTTSITIDWTDQSQAAEWEIRYRENGTNTNTSIITNSHPYTVMGLDTLTSYIFEVRAICTPGDTSRWSTAVGLSTEICDNAVAATTGPANGTSYYTPVNNYYNYTLTETIIDSAELVGIGDLIAVAYSYNYSSPSTVKTDVDIWLQPTTKTAFSSSSDIELLDTNIAVRVYSGPLNCSQGWNYFAFDTAYTWDGHSNLMVIVDDNSYDYDGSAYVFNISSCSEYKTLHWYSDSYNPDPMSSSYSGSTAYYQYRAAMKLVSCGAGCSAPNNVSFNNVSYDGATANWGGAATDYEISYKMASEGTWPDETAVSGNSYNLTGLQPATTYQFRVRSVCDADENLISDWVMGTFVTDSLPCFAPSNLQTTPGYVSVALDWTPGTSETQWNIHIWNSTKDTTVTVNTHPAVVGGLAQTTAYYAAVQALCGGGAAESDYSDTIQFTTATCAAPTGVAASNVTNTSAVVTWNGNAASYDISYGERGFGEGQGQTISGVTGSSYTITGLEPEMGYDVYVRANCEPGVPSGWSAKAEFTTTSEGIHSADGGLNVTIYPNPTTSATTISLSGVNGEVEITIVDMNGRTVKSDVMSCDGDCAKKLTVDGLAAGAYFVRISADGINAVKKLVVK